MEFHPVLVILEVHVYVCECVSLYVSSYFSFISVWFILYFSSIPTSHSHSLMCVFCNVWIVWSFGDCDPRCCACRFVTCSSKWNKTIRINTKNQKFDRESTQTAKTTYWNSCRCFRFKYFFSLIHSLSWKFVKIIICFFFFQFRRNSYFTSQQIFHFCLVKSCSNISLEGDCCIFHSDVSVSNSLGMISSPSASNQKRGQSVENSYKTCVNRSKKDTCRTGDQFKWKISFNVCLLITIATWHWLSCWRLKRSCEWLQMR